MDIQKTMDHLNEMRKKVLGQLTIFYIVMAIIEIIILVMITPFLIKVEEGIKVIVYEIGGYVGLVIWLTRLIVKKYRTTFKKELIPITLKLFGKDIKYSPEGISRGVVEAVDMFGHFTKYTSEDTVSGVIKEVSFDCADVKLGYYTGGKNKRYVKVCHGQLYIFDFNKRFRTRTIIREKKVKKPDGLEKMEVESIDFNKKFYIYSNNEHDAFYILTPHFMEKLDELEAKHDGNLYIAFDNSKLYIGIDNNIDRFEPPILSEVSQETIDAQIGDLKIIEEIIEELRLNNKIFIVDENL